ncbi:UNVERIFIED_CONTAM: hypothetical protein PYX00_008676 [Menopon gallinae]|uniref:Parathyroid hormone/parathyroid hormone-related peptide receptor n=1 Tax=Menopon gallinae TaxID=328185 RepID=A0AAW2HP34_9NEOP
MSEQVQAVLSEEDLENLLMAKKKECDALAERSRSSKMELACGTIWDGIMCWPTTYPKHLASQQCPQYFPGLDQQANATKECTENGTWFISPETQKEWTNYSQCYAGEEAVILVPVTPVNASLFKEYIPMLKKISHIGYGVSLSTLIIAFTVLITLKKLHCSRNMLHLHLFMSFIMKSMITFLKEFLFEQGIGLQSDFVVRNGTSHFIEKLNSNWECKALTTVWQYFIMANYCWLLMEGLYIHNLIIFALFTDNTSILIYVILGWGLPMIFVAMWVFVKIKLENEYCWTTKTDSKNFLIIRIPIIISILLSFVLFVNIVRLLLIKVRSTVQEETQRYWKWAKSTLILIPLFGVHYAILHGMSYSRGINEKVELVWLFCDQFFASFQGFFVAVLFCFLNSEIQTELKRKWRRVIRHGNRNHGESSITFSTLPFLCTNSRFNFFTLCRSSYNSGSGSESKASKRTETTEFITNDSVIPMMSLEKDKTGKTLSAARDSNYREADTVTRILE